MNGQTIMSKNYNANLLLVLSFTAIACGINSASATAQDSPSAPVQQLVNVSGASGIAINGYDPVAFFTDKEPVHGNFKISAEHRGATYFFASEKHKAMFAKDPDKYAPQCGGFCAFGVSVGALFPVDINTWQVQNDKLYLNLNPDILKMFNDNLDDNIAKSAANWPGLVKQHSKKK